MSEQRVSSLTAEDHDLLDRQRARITQYLREEDRGKYETAAGKSGLIRAVLDADVFSADETRSSSVRVSYWAMRSSRNSVSSG